jgi:DNA-binding GntR family transcriptional regulator
MSYGFLVAAKAGKAVSRVRAVYEEIRQDILAARLAPGEHLKVSPLCERFGASLSVVREALTRLAEQGLVGFEPQAGFSVVALDRGELIDLTDVRVQVECLAVTWSIQRAGLPWETGGVSALYVLGRTPQHVPGNSGEMSEEWASAHAAFHTALAIGCGSPVLMEIRAGLYDKSELYRHWAQPVVREGRDVHAEHAAIADAALRHDIAEATRLLERHLRLTTEILLTSELIAPSAGASSDETIGSAAG